jgi:hypothetical protein
VSLCVLCGFVGVVDVVRISKLIVNRTSSCLLFPLDLMVYPKPPINHPFNANKNTFSPHSSPTAPPLY